MATFDNYQVKTFRLPDTMADWPWRRLIHPDYEEVKAASEAWFRGCKTFTPKSQDAFEKGNFASLCAICCPWVSKEHLRTACDFMNLFFAIDEYSDAGTESGVREIADVVLDALKNPHKPRPEGETPLGAVAKEIWERGIKTATPNSQHHLIDGFSAYLGSLVHQAADRDNNHLFHTIDSYLHIRRDNIGARPAFSTIEFELDLPDHVYYHPTILKLCVHMADLVIIDNDMASYNKEQATGDDHYNSITVVMRQFNIDLDSAMDWVAAYHLEVQRKFLDGMKQVPSWGPDIDRQVQKYLNGVAMWPRGNLCWNFEGRRYFGNKGLEIQRTRQVHLLPKVIPFSKNDAPDRENVVVPDIEELEKGA